ncbi:hypothetical protein K6V90_09465 [Cupriavidus pauculus]|uniref:hypothetical protein n=1 Tax=Cupriavidus pauculus TaxID=82633 RepID=UPI001C935FC0|nr:hypothetical protein [Cupriavidus pauculus]MBY4730759.1 hypothetical protein [Cupriavidus pauculus]
MSFTLILFLYAGMMSKGDSVALSNVPGFATEQACMVAGRKAVDMTKGTFKDGRFVCVSTGAAQAGSVPR